MIFCRSSILTNAYTTVKNLEFKVVIYRTYVFSPSPLNLHQHLTCETHLWKEQDSVKKKNG